MLAGPAVDPHDQRVRRQAREAAPRAHPGRRQRDAGRRAASARSASGSIRCASAATGSPSTTCWAPSSASTSSCRAAASRPSRASGRCETEGKLTSAEQFGAVVVAERGGSVIHLRDVATVEDGMAEERTISRLNGRRGVALLVRRQSGENTVAVADAVKRELESVRARSAGRLRDAGGARRLALHPQLDLRRRGRARLRRAAGRRWSCCSSCATCARR